jgi:hypothetical protein
VGGIELGIDRSDGVASDLHRHRHRLPIDCSALCTLRRMLKKLMILTLLVGCGVVAARRLKGK